MKLRADLSTLFENTGDGVWATGADGRLVFWNRTAEAILGYSAQQVVGLLCREILAGSDCNGNRICGVPCPVKTQAEAGELVQHFEMASRTSTGEPVWLDVSILTMPADNGQPPTVVHLFRDVTMAHQIEVLVRRELDKTRLPKVEEAPTLNGELTRREVQVVDLMRAGTTTAAVAEQLFISTATVRNHIQNIFSKLGVHTRLEAVAHVNRLTKRASTTGGRAESATGSASEPDKPTSEPSS